MSESEIIHKCSLQLHTQVQKFVLFDKIQIQIIERKYEHQKLACYGYQRLFERVLRLHRVEFHIVKLQTTVILHMQDITQLALA